MCVVKGCKGLQEVDYSVWLYLALAVARVLLLVPSHMGVGKLTSGCWWHTTSEAACNPVPSHL